jgi:hyaluronate lyase
MELSRRNFLLTTGGTAAGILVINASPAFAADEYDTLRTRWADFIKGSGYDPAAEPFASALATQAALASDNRTTMNPTTGSLWPDLPIGTVSANVTTSFARLSGMAKAWAMPGTSQTGNAATLSAVLTGLDWMNTNAYTSGRATYNNWWDWQIGSPQILLTTMTLVYSSLTGTQISNYLAAVDHYIPDSRYSSYSGTSTGANRTDLCQSTILRGIIGKNSAKITLGRNALSPVFPYVTDGDGFYVDGSFIQHSVIPYTATYGGELIRGLSGLFMLLAGSSWAVSDPNKQLFLDMVDKGYAPFIYNGIAMDGVSGRGISRGLSTTDPLQLQSDDHRRGHGLINSILVLAEGASTTERARWRAMAKGWLQRDYWSPPLSDQAMGITALARFKALLDDASVTASAEPVNSKVFAGMDRVTHRRAGWAASISMCSSRTSFYEHGNGENVRGWHTNNGMLYTWGTASGNGQFSDAFWPTVDPYRLSGTTVSKKPLADAAGGAWGGLMPTNNWAGGATDGEYSIAGHNAQGAQSTLTAKKSWICLDDTIICLGAGITSTDGYAAESILDNRNLGSGTGTQTLLVNGSAALTTVGSSGTFTGVTWAHTTFGGFVFPGGATIKGVRENRSGAWHDINSGGTTTVLSRKYLTLWYDHGTNPTNATYAYQMLPFATSTAVSARAADTAWMTVYNNSQWQQAVYIPSKGVTAINFWSAPLGTIGGILVDLPASVLLRVSGSTATICLADPRQDQGDITLTYNKPVSAVTSKDSTVTVVSTGSSLVLRFATAGSAGKSHKATFTLT